MLLPLNIEREISMRGTKEIMLAAYRESILIPAINIPYLPVMEPVVAALKDLNTFGLIAVARPEWMKFGAKSIEAIREEFEKFATESCVRLHLDHVPVIDEDHLPVEFESIIEKAIELGYQSVMVDGSRLTLDENIAATRKIVEMAHKASIPVEAELGSVLGHEAGPLPPYDELFNSGKGFTDPDEAERFVHETKVDWLSIAFGSIHGAISESERDRKKVAARLNIEHLKIISDRVKIPLVLHGGSGIQVECIKSAVKKGIAKINIGTEVRQQYEAGLKSTGSEEGAQQKVYDTVTSLVHQFGVENSRDKVNP